MGFLSVGPRIRKEEGCVVARTAYTWRILLLGTALRKVKVDPTKKHIVIESRYLWFFPKRKLIRFSSIDAITYGYEDAADSIFTTSHNAMDCFSVGLRLKDADEFKLFTFYGEGGFVNDGPWPDWCYWEEFTFDFVGNQEQEARAFVDLLEAMTGTKVVRPRY